MYFLENAAKSTLLVSSNNVSIKFYEGSGLVHKTVSAGLSRLKFIASVILNDSVDDAIKILGFFFIKINSLGGFAA